jgi:hypothetical protein
MARDPTPFDPMAPMQSAKRSPEPGPSLRPQRHVMRPIEEYVEFEEETQLRIPRSEWPAGFALKWVTFSVFGQPFPQVRARSEKGGWVPVHQEDFDGRYRGRFMPADYNGEINVDGLVLMARPQTWDDKANRINTQRAQQRVQIKEQQLRSGDLGGVTLSPDHPTAVRSNIINRAVEAIQVPSK